MQLSELYRIYRERPHIITDSRQIEEGAIFLALKGERFDGNQYARQAIEQGCAYAVIDEPEYDDPNDDRIILVDDCLATLQALARLHRRTLGTHIIGVTGTNGKTTTKELIATVLGKKYNVLFTEGNLNNHIGVPKTLLRLRPEHDMAVVEMGANHQCGHGPSRGLRQFRGRGLDERRTLRLPAAAGEQRGVHTP